MNTLRCKALFRGRRLRYNKEDLNHNGGADMPICQTITDEHIPDGAFAENAELTCVALPYARSIGGGAFARCPNLTRVIFSESLRVICEDAFFGCENLREIELPSGVVTIGERAFSKTGLLAVCLPQSVKICGNSCFEDCKALASVFLPERLSMLGASAFSGCKSLQKIALPEIASVRDGCFAGCAFSRVDLPDAVSYIGRDAFSGCKSLRVARLRAGDIRLRGTAFDNCENLCHIIRRHKNASEHRVFSSPPATDDVTRKLSSYDKKLSSAPAALFRLSFPVALFPEDRERFVSLVLRDVQSARNYLQTVTPYLDPADVRTARQTLLAIDPAARGAL